MKKLILSVLAIAAMTSCTKSSVEDLDPNAPVEIKFGAGINMMSRAAIESNGNLPTTTVTGIQILRGTDGSTPAFATVSNVATTADLKIDGNFENISNSQYYESKTDAANFIAYYPAGTLTAGKVEFTIDGTTDIIAAPKASTTYSTTPSSVDFTFNHKLARLKLVVKAENQSAIDFYGDLENAKIEVPSKLEMTIDANGTTGALTANATPTNITLDFATVALNTNETPAGKDFIILPTVAPSAIKLTFAKVEEKSYDITGLVLEAGKITTLTVTVNATGIDFTSKITNWTNGGTNGETTVGGN